MNVDGLWGSGLRFSGLWLALEQMALLEFPRGLCNCRCKNSQEFFPVRVVVSISLLILLRINPLASPAIIR